MRRRALAVFIGLAVASTATHGASEAAAAAPSSEPETAAQNGPGGAGGSEYESTVKLYASGDHKAAVAALGKWTESELRRNTRIVGDDATRLRGCSACAEPNRSIAQQYSRFPLRAAILLHVDREIFDQIERPESEQPARCGIGPHSIMMKHLATILLILDPSAHTFLRRAYLAISRHALWSHCVPEAQNWARLGLMAFPKDAPLRLALANATEARAFFTFEPSPAASMLSLAKAQMGQVTGGRGLLWEDARRAFEDVLVVEPDHAEARLRLGRVLWRLGQPEASVPCFDSVLAKSGDPALQYLAHLFLGRVLEDKGNLLAAEEHYRSAQAIEPLSTTAAVALSHVRFFQDDPESAREILSASLDASRLRTEIDPWVSYEVPQTPDGELTLAELRRTVLQ